MRTSWARGIHAYHARLILKLYPQLDLLSRHMAAASATAKRKWIMYDLLLALAHSLWAETRTLAQTMPLPLYLRCRTTARWTLR
jgi:hypothetical protein